MNHILSHTIVESGTVAVGLCGATNDGAYYSTPFPPYHPQVNCWQCIDRLAAMRRDFDAEHVAVLTMVSQAYERGLAGLDLVIIDGNLEDPKDHRMGVL